MITNLEEGIEEIPICGIDKGFDKPNHSSKINEAEKTKFEYFCCDSRECKYRIIKENITYCNYLLNGIINGYKQ